jgi:hypothetical protein
MPEHGSTHVLLPLVVCAVEQQTDFLCQAGSPAAAVANLSPAAMFSPGTAAGSAHTLAVCVTSCATAFWELTD